MGAVPFLEAWIECGGPFVKEITGQWTKELVHVISVKVKNAKLRHLSYDLVVGERTPDNPDFDIHYELCRGIYCPNRGFLASMLEFKP
jgi:hypothetical protein